MAFSELSQSRRDELGIVAAPLRPALVSFAAGRISADEFEAAFLREFQKTGDTSDRLIGGTLDELFFAVDDYVGHGMTVEPDDGDIDADQLLQRVRQFNALAGYSTD